MARLLAQVLQWIARKLGLLLVIIGVLLIGAWLKAEWDEHQTVQDSLDQQDSLLAGLRSELQAIEEAVSADDAEWRRQTIERLRTRWLELDALAGAAEQQSRQKRSQFQNLNRQAQATRQAANKARAQLAALEREAWWWDAYLRPDKQAALGIARAKYAALDKTADAAETTRRRAAIAAASWHKRVRQLRGEQSTVLQDIEDPAASPSPRHASLAAERARKQQAIATAESTLAAQRAQVERNPRERLIARARSKLPLALGILVGILLLPLAIKSLLYFVLAPLASRLAPIRILPSADAAALPEPRPSAVSVSLDIAPGQELLVQPDFLQSSSRPAFKRTRWFLNPRLPFASLASGMFALTCVRPEGDARTRVVVSSQSDPFGEVGVIGLPAGAAMVVHPRSLAGVVKPAGVPTHITRHWRLGSLHAWLTLQLRYLVFHGPCQLILKGCRGVRSEQPMPEQPRLINQAATLGFSANLDYRTIRCETFVPYLRGHEELFNDLFGGGPGWFVYEEMPASSRRAGITGRGLEGLADAVLKAFGI